MTLLGGLLIPSLPASNQYQVVYYQSTPNRRHKVVLVLFVFGESFGLTKIERTYRLCLRS